MRLHFIFKCIKIEAAVAQAWTCGDLDSKSCDFAEWLEDNWPAPVDESFNFVSNNWDQYDFNQK